MRSIDRESDDGNNSCDANDDDNDDVAFQRLLYFENITLSPRYDVRRYFSLKRSFFFYFNLKREIREWTFYENVELNKN